MDDRNQGNSTEWPWYIKMWSRLRNKFGVFYACAAAAAFLGLWAWWNWPSISEKPFVGRLVETLERHPLPRVPHHTMTIGITRLVDDPSREHEQLIRDALANDFKGINEVFLDRSIRPSDDETDQKSIEEAALAADRLRESSGVDVLLWGRVITLGGRSLTRLYWTARKDMSVKFTDRYPDPTDTIALPPLLAEDLRHVIALLAETEVMSAVATENTQIVTERVRFTLSQVAALLEQRSQWNSRDFNEIKKAFADGLELYGALADNMQAIQQSISIYKDLIRQRDVQLSPSHWADVQQHLGIALKAAGVRETAPNSLLESVDAFTNALKVFTVSAFPAQWAAAELALGSALETLAVRAKENSLKQRHFSAAVESYNAALRVCTKERERNCWLMARMNLGNALDDWGQSIGDNNYTRLSIGIFQDLVRNLSRDSEPVALAEVQMNLGVALNAFGRNTSNEGRVPGRGVGAVDK